jgi:hypothetical protein
VEPCREVGEQVRGGVLQRCLIGPPTVTAELGFDVAPDALYQVQLRSIDRQLQRTHPVVIGHPPVLGKPNLVVADIVQDHHERPIEERGHLAIEERDEGRSRVVWAELPHELL